MPTSLEKIQSLQNQIAKELDGAKTELCKQIQKAADNYKELIAVAGTDIWKDPQYGQALAELGLTPTSQYELALASKPTKTKSSRGPAIPMEEKIARILKALEGGNPVPTPQIVKTSGVIQAGLILNKELSKKVTRTGKGGKQGYCWQLKK